ncbi:hypothetical protein NM06_03295 [Vibrio sinaloensis]|uniref:Uncharacterized protein n=1 Tax=Photobacterium sp. (strain ATCC 43367) TaxID=379097 RepID=A0A0A5I2F9_PHOS4|nr:hypothetical protein NM06_03295 [Vibrio sinaloensis]KHT46705.1 hypothetical protein RJ47_04820 [Vibrio sinaloensis]KHT50465.1 hypothetical protein RJ46_06230 [Vibrio sinaloensis]
MNSRKIDARKRLEKAVIEKGWSMPSISRFIGYDVKITLICNNGHSVKISPRKFYSSSDKNKCLMCKSKKNKVVQRKDLKVKTLHDLLSPRGFEILCSMYK